MFKSTTRHNRSRAFLLLLALASPLAAQEAGNTAIEIQADSAELDRAAGRSTYRGDVILTRGGLELHGDRLVVTRDDGENITAVLTGSPTRLRQAPTGTDTPPVTGTARRITYAAGQGRIELHGQAVIERGGDAVRGDRITHDLNSGVTQAHRGGDDQGERVRITLDPADNGEAGDGD